MNINPCAGHGGGFVQPPTGESDDGSLRVDFGRCLKRKFHGTRIASDGGLLADREADDALGLTEMADATGRSAAGARTPVTY